MRCLIIRGRQRLFNVMWYGIKKMDCVAESGEPESMDAGSAADVEDRRGHGREMSLQNVLGANAFELPDTVRQPVGLLDLPIMLEHLWGQRMTQHTLHFRCALPFSSCRGVSLPMHPKFATSGIMGAASETSC